MKSSVVDRYLRCVAAPLVLLSGCAAPAAMPPGPQQATAQSRSIQSPATAKSGLYVSVFESGAPVIIGYNRKYKHVCTIEAGYASAISADRAGNLLAANGATKIVAVYQGPQLCGPEYGSFSDPFGQPASVSSRDALHGTIAVGNIFDTSGAGSIAVCTLAGGCTANLTNSNMYEVAGVAIARNGDCWADATNSLGTATLTYFRRCAGKGRSATGFVNQYYGGIQIDGHGNLVTIDAFNSQIYVYKGCAPRCSLVRGPFALHGDAVYGSLNAKSTMFATADYENGEIDVYRYSPTGLTYRFSFQPSGSTSESFGVAYSPGG